MLEAQREAAVQAAAAAHGPRQRSGAGAVRHRRRRCQAQRHGVPDRPRLSYEMQSVQRLRERRLAGPGARLGVLSRHLLLLGLVRRYVRDEKTYRLLLNRCSCSLQALGSERVLGRR